MNDKIKKLKNDYDQINLGNNKKNKKIIERDKIIKDLEIKYTNI